MKTRNRKGLGIALVSAAVALFGWITYEPANVMATFQLEGVASEATVVLITLALAGLAMAGGCALMFTRLGISAIAGKA